MYAPVFTKQSVFKFGLNEKVFLKTFELKKENDNYFIQVEFEKEGSTISTRIYEVKKVFFDGKEITNPEHQEFVKQVNDVSAVITHYITKFIEKEIIVNSFVGKKISGFADFAKLMISLLPQNFNEIPLDLFLRWSWSIKEGQNTTFLEIPNTMKHGEFIALHTEDNWVEIVNKGAKDNETALWYEKYVDDKVLKHPFKRTGWFMNSNYAVRQQKLEEQPVSKNSEQMPF